MVVQVAIALILDGNEAKDMGLHYSRGQFPFVPFVSIRVLNIHCASRMLRSWPCNLTLRPTAI